MLFQAGITNAKPILTGLGIKRAYLKERIFWSVIRPAPTKHPTIEATIAPRGAASIPSRKSSATAIQVATAGAGHSGVKSIFAGLGINRR